jgi:hypothetical protein
VGVGVTTRLGRGEDGIEDRERKSGGAWGGQWVEREGIRAKGVGGWIVGRRHKGWEAANGFVGGAEFGADEVAERDSEGLGG